MDVSDQIHVPVALYQGKEPPVPVGWEARWHLNVKLNALKKEKTSSICRESNIKSLVIKPKG
jgi:hypothetical protein